MRNTGLRFLRPYLYQGIQPARRATNLAFAPIEVSEHTVSPAVQFVDQKATHRSGDVQQRITELQEAGVELYPRLRRDARSISCLNFNHKYAALKPGTTCEEDVTTVRGM